MDWKQRTIEVAQDYGIDPNIAIAQINAESGFNPRADNGIAYGLAQFTPGTWASYGRGDMFDGEASLQAWAKYMLHLLDRFDWNYELALAGYHAGERDAVAALNNPKGNPRTNDYVNKIIQRAWGTSISWPNTGAATDPGAPADTNWLLLGAVGLVLAYLALK